MYTAVSIINLLEIHVLTTLAPFGGEVAEIFKNPDRSELLSLKRAAHSSYDEHVRFIAVQRLKSIYAFSIDFLHNDAVLKLIEVGEVRRTDDLIKRIGKIESGKIVATDTICNDRIQHLADDSDFEKSISILNNILNVYGWVDKFVPNFTEDCDVASLKNMLEWVKDNEADD